MKFNPDKIDSLAIGARRDVDVAITPSAKAIAGDYMVSLTASADAAMGQSLDIRTTVVSPSSWGWVGVGIVVAVVAGLVYLFMRLGRR
jgi:uncharacterized membrane protein